MEGKKYWGEKKNKKKKQDPVLACTLSDILARSSISRARIRDKCVLASVTTVAVS